jgi:hypothetical protein
VATNLLKAAIASGNHDITIFTRSIPSTPHPSPNVTYKQVDYTDLASLTSALQGFHTVLSFFVVHLDENCVGQKNLIHASIAAGVKRFAPSEWGIKNGSGVPAYDNKEAIRAYLEDLEKKGELGGMQYCLFQPSIFMDYFAHPNPLEKDLITWPFFADLENRRAMMLDQGDQPIVLTAVQDDSQMLSRALDDERPWPKIGGFRGARTSIKEKVRGGDWTIDYVKGEDVKAGKLETSWIPPISHPTIPEDMRETYSKQFVIQFFVGILNGSWDVSDEWNQRLPDFKTMGLEEYLTKAWAGKP